MATEAGQALIDFARRAGRLPRLVSAVDEPNVASARVLEKLGFRPHGHAPGAFGPIILLERPDDAGDTR